MFAPIKSAIQTRSSIYNFIKQSEDQRELHEAKRLLYVAITRAKKKFYGFSGNLNGVNKSFIKFLEPYVVDDKKILIDYNKDDTEKQNVENIFVDNNATKSILLKRIPLKWYIEQSRVQSL